MGRYVAVFICTFFVYLNCTEKNTQFVKQIPQKQNIKDKNVKVENQEECITTLDDGKICDLGRNKLDGKIQKIEKKEFIFEASPLIYNNKIAINRASPVSFYITDYKRISLFLDNKTSQYLQNPKASYLLNQHGKEIAIKSFQILELEQNIQYIFSAVCYTISTTKGKGNIVVIRNIKKK